MQVFFFFLDEKPGGVESVCELSHNGVIICDGGDASRAARVSTLCCWPDCTHASATHSDALDDEHKLPCFFSLDLTGGVSAVPTPRPLRRKPPSTSAKKLRKHENDLKEKKKLSESWLLPRRCSHGVLYLSGAGRRGRKHVREGAGWRKGERGSETHVTCLNDPN